MAMTALLAVWKMSLCTVRPDLIHCLSARRLSRLASRSREPTEKTMEMEGGERPNGWM